MATKRKKKPTEKEQFFAARGVPAEHVDVPGAAATRKCYCTNATEPTLLQGAECGCCNAKRGEPCKHPAPPRKPTDAQRIADLEARLETLCGAIIKRDEEVQKWANGVAASLQTLHDNDRKVLDAVRTHHHTVFGVI